MWDDSKPLRAPIYLNPALSATLLRRNFINLILSLLTSGRHESDHGKLMMTPLAGTQTKEKREYRYS